MAALATAFQSCSCVTMPAVLPHAPGSDEIVRTLNVDGFSYTLHLYPERTWSEARKRCQADGRDLVRLYSREHGANLHAAVVAVQQDTTKVYWLGLTDAAQEGTWLWSLDEDTLNAAEANWDVWEPSDTQGGENCGTVRPSGRWNDASCSSNVRTFACGPVGALAATVRARYLDPRSISVDGASYIVHVAPANWTEADKRCRQDSQQLLRLYSRQHGINVHAEVGKVTDIPYWLGLTDAAREGTWVWSTDGATLSTAETNWGGGEPNNAGTHEHCASVGLRSCAGGLPCTEEKWNDAPCGAEMAYVCAANITSACARFPCGAPATCTPSSAVSAPSSPAGRMCSCPSGATYVDDVVGCSSHATQRLDIGDGMEYTLFTSPLLTWYEAESVCRARGTSLVKITSADQADKLHAAVRDVLPPPAPDMVAWLRWSYWCVRGPVHVDSCVAACCTPSCPLRPLPLCRAFVAGLASMTWAAKTRLCGPATALQPPTRAGSRATLTTAQTLRTVRAHLGSRASGMIRPAQSAGRLFASSSSSRCQATHECTRELDACFSCSSIFLPRRRIKLTCSSILPACVHICICL